MKKLLCFSIFILSLSLIGEGFIAKTLVKTPSGHTPIKKLAIGDKVISYDFRGSFTEKLVTHKSKKTSEKLVAIIFENNEKIIAEPTQKFYVHTSQLWVKAKDILPGDILSSYSFQHLVVQDTYEINQRATTYNITVNNLHNYLVSLSDVQVHNIVPAVIPLITISSEGLAVLGGAGAATAAIVGKKLINDASKKIAEALGITVYKEPKQTNNSDYHVENNQNWPNNCPTVFDPSQIPHQSHLNTQNNFQNNQFQNNQFANNQLPKISEKDLKLDIDRIGNAIQQSYQTNGQKIQSNIQAFSSQIEQARKLIELDPAIEQNEKEAKLYLLDYIENLLHQSEVLSYQGKIKEAEALYEIVDYSLYGDVFEDIPLYAALKDKDGKKVIKNIKSKDKRNNSGPKNSGPQKPKDPKDPKKDENYLIESVAGCSVLKKIRIELRKIYDHLMNSEHEIEVLSKSPMEVFRKILSEIKFADSQSKLKQGYNRFETIIDGFEIEIRCYLEDGELISANGFNGYSSRINPPPVKLR